MTDPLTNKAWTLIDSGAPTEALKLTGPAARGGQASANLLMAHAAALKAVGRPDQALTFGRRSVEREPMNRFAWYNLAATLGDTSRHEEAETAARRALALGLDAPEVWLVLGKALQGLRRYDEAERALLAALSRRPDFAAAHLDLAQLRWMRSGRQDQALTILDAAIARRPGDPSLRLIRSTVLTFAGDKPAADATLEEALRLAPSDVTLRVAASRSAGAVDDDERMLRHAREAQRLAPAAGEVQAALCEALLATGQVQEAADVAERMVAASPDDQYALVLRNTAWRMTGDPRAAPFGDYGSLVRTTRLETPEGWPSLDAFLDALRARLLELHDLKAHPLLQSLRGGTQAPSLDRSDDPLVRAFFDSARKAVARYIDELGPGEDPIRRRRTTDFAFAGGWSVRLRSAGYHADHVHPRGWISSAFYLDLPDCVDDDQARQGWPNRSQPCPPSTTSSPNGGRWRSSPRASGTGPARSATRRTA